MTEHERERLEYELDFLDLFGIRPWEMDLLTVEQFERFRLLIDERRARGGNR